MKKNYESPKTEIVSLKKLSFLELSGDIFGGAGDKYAEDRFDSSFGNSF